MQSLGETIRARRVQMGLTVQELADRAGCAKSYISTIENERKEGPPSEGLLARLEDALGFEEGSLVLRGRWEATPSEIRREVMDIEQRRRLGERLAQVLRERGLDEAHKSGELARLVERLAPEGSQAVRQSGSEEKARRHEGTEARSRSVGNVRLMALPVQAPLINKVAAGYPTEFTDLGYPARVADEYVSAPGVTDADAFAARVVGDSMMPVYREGDIVVFSPERDTKDGDDCFVRLERDDETTFKRVYFETGVGGAEMIRLQPLNSAYAARVLAREDVAGLYAAVYVIRAVGNGE